MNNMGSRIRKRRIELGMTQAELAKKLGYTNKSSIGKIENNTNHISSQKVKLFAEALETSESYLYGDAPEGAVSKNKKELMDIIQSLPEEQVQTLLLGLKTTLHK